MRRRPTLQPRSAPFALSALKLCSVRSVGFHYPPTAEPEPEPQHKIHSRRLVVDPDAPPLRQHGQPRHRGRRLRPVRRRFGEEGQVDVPQLLLQLRLGVVPIGGRVLAVESQQTILLDADDVIALADRLGIAIVALNADELRLRIAS